MRIRIVRKKMPSGSSVDSEIEWFCSTLGLCEHMRDDESATRIFRCLLERGRYGRGLRSDDISERVGKSRGAVVNQLNKLMAAGLVARRGTRYELREDTLLNTLVEMRRDLERVFEDMEDIARKIDEDLKRRP